MSLAAMSRRARELAYQGESFVTATVVRAHAHQRGGRATWRWCSPTARSRASSAAPAPSTACARTPFRRSRAGRRCCSGSSVRRPGRDRPRGPGGGERGRRGDRREPVPVGRCHRDLPGARGARAARARGGRHADRRGPPRSAPSWAWTPWLTDGDVGAAAGRPRARGGRARPGRALRAAPRPRGRLPYVGLVASAKRGDGVIGELRGDGVAPELLERIDVPAGLDIGARTPAEIALSILAKVVAVRRTRARRGGHGGRPDLRDDGGRGGRHALGAARGRDRLLLLRGLQGQVRGGPPACRRRLTRS